MKRRIKEGFVNAWRLLPELIKRTTGMLAQTMDIVLPCVLVLGGLYILVTMGERNRWAEDMAFLLQAAESIVVIPAIAGMVTYMVGARWEKRGVKLMDALHLVRIRIKSMVKTGLVVGLVGIAVNWLGMTLYSIVHIISIVLDWIPVVGIAVAGAAACILWLISLGMQFFVHVALVMGMMALTTDGMSGGQQAARVIGVVQENWSEVKAKLLPVFGMWMIGKGTYDVMSYTLPTGALFAWDAVLAVMMLCSMVAVSVIYLEQRDKKDGMIYYA